MNRGQLVGRTGLKFGINVESDGDSKEIAFLQDTANEGVVDVLLKTHAYKQIGEMNLISGTSEYRLDSLILAIDDGRGSTPEGIGPYQLITLSEMIDYQSVNPVGGGLRKLICIEGDLMIVAPTPGAGELLRFYYVPRPAQMTADTHDPATSEYGGIPSEFHRAILSYMDWQVADYDDKREPLTAEKYRSAYDNECKAVRKGLRRKAGRGIRPARVGYPPRYRPSRNDVYPR